MKNKRLLDFTKLEFEVRNAMRYDDVGDYFGNKIITYNFDDEIIQNAILLHEFIEYTLITSAGIPVEIIDKLDTDPKAKKKYPHEYKLYSKFHNLANRVERQFIENLGLNWEDHDETIYSRKVMIAVQQITDELHADTPAKEIKDTVEESKQVVEEVLK